MNATGQCSECSSPLTKGGFCPRCALTGLGEVASGSFSTIGSATSETAAGGGAEFGPFDLLAPLPEQGAMGIVYRARHRPTRRVVALKLLRSDHLISEEKVNRFQREVEAMARLDHPGILPVYEVGRHHGQPYFSMKLVEEGSLKEQMRAGRWRMGEEEPRAWQRQIASLIETVSRAVHHAHQRGILHRDLKPANILVDAQGQPFVTDFGLAKFIEPGTDLTSAQVFLGTPDYSSPEQARGQSDDLTIATDIWGLGVMLYELFTGVIPFRGDSSSAVLEQIKLTEPKRPRLINGVVDRDLETICLKCLEKEPGRRYGSAEALADDLRRYGEGEPVQARPVSQGERLWKWVRRRRVLAGWIGATALALFLGLTISTWQWWRATAMARKLAELAAQSQGILSDFLRTDGGSLEALHRTAMAVEIAPRFPTVVRRLLSALTWRDYALPLSSVGPTGSPDHRIIGARYSPDGRQFLTLSVQGELQVWDARTGDPVGSACRQSGLINLFGFSPDGRMIFAANGTNNPVGPAEVRIWQVGSSEPLAALAHWGAITDLRFSPDGRTVLTADMGTVRQWSLESGQASNRVAQLLISTAAFSADGRLVAVSPAESNAAAATVWNVESGTRLVGPLEAGSAIADLAFDAEAGHLLAVCRTGHLHRWRIPDGASVGASRLEAGLGEVRLNRSGTRALVRSDPSARFRGDQARHTTWLFAITNLAQPLRQFPEHYFAPGPAFSRDGNRFVLVKDTTATLHDSADGVARREPLNVGWWIEDTDFDDTGERLVVAASRPKAVVYDLRPGQATPATQVLRAGEQVKALSPDGSLAALLATDHSIRVIDSKTGREVCPALPHPGRVQRVGLGSTPARLASVCVASQTNLEVRVWDLAGAGLMAPPLLFGPGDPLLKWDRATSQLLVAEDTNVTVVVVKEGGIVTWEFDLAAGVTVDPQVGLGQVWNIEFSPDGRRFAVASYGLGAQIWSLRTRRREHLLAHSGPVIALAFSPDGGRLATGSMDRTARVWELEGGTLSRRPLWHFREVSRVCWAPGGERLFTGTSDGHVLAWDLDPDRRSFRFQHKMHNRAVARMQVSQAADLVVSLDLSGDLKCWDPASGVQVTEPVGGVSVEAGFALAGGGTVLLAPSATSGLRHFPLPAIPTSAPDWLVQIGYGLAAAQPTEELPVLLKLRADTGKSGPRGFYEDWRRWFFADRETRPPSPW